MAEQHQIEADEDSTLHDRMSDRRSLADTWLKRFFEAAVKHEATDLLMRGGREPRVRLRGELRNMQCPPLDQDAFEQAVQEGLSPSQWRYYLDHGAIDLGIDLDENHRFRVNVYRSRGRSAIAARRVSNQILNFEQLHLPPILESICTVSQGLILLAGITGCGKSTTLAAMLDHINHHRSCHIVTIEDPIEFLFTDDKALISQREVGIDIPNFSLGLKYLVREDPDVVLIGEMRDRETLDAAFQAAETGHLVLGTLHASSAPQAFGRIYDLFPETERELVRYMLAYQLQAIVYQKLLPTIREDVDLVPAAEVLLQHPTTRKYILEGRENELDEVIRDQREAGMQTFTDSLVELVNQEFIHPRVAQGAANSPEEVKMRLKGIVAE